MANEYFEVQTYADVQQIDHRKETNAVMNNQIQQQIPQTQTPMIPMNIFW